MQINSDSYTFQNFATQARAGQETQGPPREKQDPEHNNVAPATETKESDRSGKEDLNQKQAEEVRELSARDREVRTHEAAHKAAGGSLTGPASFSFSNGPDGKRYATGGEVSIDTSKVAGDNQATLIKANQIRAAALAPAQPSNTDQAVAAKAAQMAAETRVKILSENDIEARADTNKPNTPNDDIRPINKTAAYQTSTSNPPTATIDVLA